MSTLYHVGMSERIDQLRKLLEAEPDDVFCLYSLAQEHAKAGDHPAAIDQYRRVIDLDPDYFYAYFHQARSLDAEDRREEAIGVLRTGLDRTKAAGDSKAETEIQALLDELT